jgi:hypothetical protein
MSRHKKGKKSPAPIQPGPPVPLLCACTYTGALHVFDAGLPNWYDAGGTSHAFSVPYTPPPIPYVSPCLWQLSDTYEGLGIQTTIVRASALGVSPQRWIVQVLVTPGGTDQFWSMMSGLCADGTYANEVGGQVPTTAVVHR